MKGKKQRKYRNETNVKKLIWSVDKGQKHRIKQTKLVSYNLEKTKERKYRYHAVTKGAKMDIRQTFDCHINFTMK